jgi:hypothetical protein
VEKHTITVSESGIDVTISVPEELLKELGEIPQYPDDNPYSREEFDYHLTTILRQLALILDGSLSVNVFQRFGMLNLSGGLSDAADGLELFFISQVRDISTQSN